MSAKHKAKGKNYRARDDKKGKENPDDFFPTYHALTKVLLDALQFDQNTHFLEPCAGAGDITKIIRQYYPAAKISEYDLNPRRDGVIARDFLKNDPIKCDSIITNPPFNMAMDFFKQSTLCADRDIVMLWPLDYLHGSERQDVIYDMGYNNFYLKTVYVFERRPLFDARFRPDGQIPTGATSFAWFYFKKYNALPPEIKWLIVKPYMGVPTEKEQITFTDLENRLKQPDHGCTMTEFVA